jgi:hypothetical protein
LPVGPEIQFFQENTISVTDVPEVHETPVDVADVAYLLVPKELVVIVRVVPSIVFSLSVLVL